MHCQNSTILLLLPLLLWVSQTAHSFKLPTGGVNGVYQASIDSQTGQEVHVLLDGTDQMGQDHAPLSVVTRMTRPLIRPRKGKIKGELYCSCSEHLNHDETELAVIKLENKVSWPGLFSVRPTGSFYARENGTVAFACNASEIWIASMTEDWISGAMEEVTAACGLDVVGTFARHRLIGRLLMGYAAAREGQTFCEADESWPDHC